MIEKSLFFGSSHIPNCCIRSPERDGTLYLYIVCSGGKSLPAGEALVVQFNLISSRLADLEAKGSFRFPVFENFFFPKVSAMSTEILALQSGMTSVIERHQDTKA